VEVQAGGRILHCVAGRPDTRVLVAGSGGYGFITTLGDMVSTRRAGREFMALEPGEAPLAPFVFEDSPGNYVAALSERGRLLLFSIAEMKRLARGRGVIVMGLETDEKLAAVAVSDQQELSVSGVAPRSGKSKTLVLAGEKLAHYCGHRARMGRGLPEKLRPPLGLSVPARSGA
jgi:topoisomerase-4 subunit A